MSLLEISVTKHIFNLATSILVIKRGKLKNYYFKLMTTTIITSTAGFFRFGLFKEEFFH